MELSLLNTCVATSYEEMRFKSSSHFSDSRVQAPILITSRLYHVVWSTHYTRLHVCYNSSS